jgi:hypothetical protein
MVLMAGTELPSRAIRDVRYKLIRKPAGDELYDLLTDPFEQHDLIQAELSSALQAIYAGLSSKLNSLLASN